MNEDVYASCPDCQAAGYDAECARCGGDGFVGWDTLTDGERAVYDDDDDE